MIPYYNTHTMKLQRYIVIQAHVYLSQKRYYKPSQTILSYDRFNTHAKHATISSHYQVAFQYRTFVHTISTDEGSTVTLAYKCEINIIKIRHNLWLLNTVKCSHLANVSNRLKQYFSPVIRMPSKSYSLYKRAYFWRPGSKYKLVYRKWIQWRG